MQYDENAEKYGYEGEMTPMKCDELEAYGMDDPAIGEEYEMYKVADVDAAIAELKDVIHELQTENTELKVQVNGFKNRSNLWEYNAQNEHNAAVAVRMENAKLKKKLEDAKATHYAESVDAGMRERRLKRALWVTRTAWAKSEKDRWNAHVDCGNRRNRKDPAFVKTGKLLEVSEWRKLWADNERKCRAKAEEYR